MIDKFGNQCITIRNINKAVVSGELTKEYVLAKAEQIAETMASEISEVFNDGNILKPNINDANLSMSRVASLPIEKNRDAYLKSLLLVDCTRVLQGKETKYFMNDITNA